MRMREIIEGARLDPNFQSWFHGSKVVERLIPLTPVPPLVVGPEQFANKGGYFYKGLVVFPSGRLICPGETEKPT